MPVFQVNKCWCQVENGHNVKLWAAVVFFPLLTTGSFFSTLSSGQWEANDITCCCLPWWRRNNRTADSFRYVFVKSDLRKCVQCSALRLLQGGRSSQFTHYSLTSAVAACLFQALALWVNKRWLDLPGYTWVKKDTGHIRLLYFLLTSSDTIITFYIKLYNYFFIYIFYSHLFMNVE